MKKRIFSFLVLLILLVAVSSWAELEVTTSTETWNESSPWNVKFVRAVVDLPNPYDDEETCNVIFQFKNTTSLNVGIENGDHDGRARWNVTVGIKVHVFDKDGNFNYSKKLGTYLKWDNDKSYTYDYKSYLDSDNLFFIKDIYQDANGLTSLIFKFPMDSFHPKAKITGFIKVDDHFDEPRFKATFESIVATCKGYDNDSNTTTPITTVTTDPTPDSDPVVTPTPDPTPDSDPVVTPTLDPTPVTPPSTPTDDEIIQSYAETLGMLNMGDNLDLKIEKIKDMSGVYQVTNLATNSSITCKTTLLDSLLCKPRESGDHISAIISNLNDNLTLVSFVRTRTSKALDELTHIANIAAGYNADPKSIMAKLQKYRTYFEWGSTVLLIPAVGEAAGAAVGATVVTGVTLIALVDVTVKSGSMAYLSIDKNIVKPIIYHDGNVNLVKPAITSAIATVTALITKGAVSKFLKQPKTYQLAMKFEEPIDNTLDIVSSQADKLRMQIPKATEKMSDAFLNAKGLTINGLKQFIKLIEAKATNQAGNTVITQLEKQVGEITLAEWRPLKYTTEELVELLNKYGSATGSKIEAIGSSRVALGDMYEDVINTLVNNGEKTVGASVFKNIEAGKRNVDALIKLNDGSIIIQEVKFTSQEIPKLAQPAKDALTQIGVAFNRIKEGMADMLIPTNAATYGADITQDQLISAYNQGNLKGLVISGSEDSAIVGSPDWFTIEGISNTMSTIEEKAKEFFKLLKSGEDMLHAPSNSDNLSAQQLKLLQDIENSYKKISVDQALTETN